MQIAEIIVSIIVIGLILLQERSAGLSGLFGGGGDSGGGVYQARRGVEKFVFAGTIIFGIIFLVLSVAKLFFS